MAATSALRQQEPSAKGKGQSTAQQQQQQQRARQREWCREQGLAHDVLVTMRDMRRQFRQQLEQIGFCQPVRVTRESRPDLFSFESERGR